MSLGSSVLDILSLIHIRMRIGDISGICNMGRFSDDGLRLITVIGRKCMGAPSINSKWVAGWLAVHINPRLGYL